jgi:hypothetical protein
VLAWSQKDDEKAREVLTSTVTDAQGQFRLKVVKGIAIFWLLPEKYAVSEHQLNGKSGDQGKLTLAPGLTLQGKVLDAKGKALAGVNVNAWRVDSQRSVPDIGNQGSAVANEKGEFTIEGLAPGRYVVQPSPVPHWVGWRSLGAFLEDKAEFKTYPVPDFFAATEVTLKEGAKPKALEVRAILTVKVTIQFLDGDGKPAWPTTSWNFAGKFLTVPDCGVAPVQRR